MAGSLSLSVSLPWNKQLNAINMFTLLHFGSPPLAESGYVGTGHIVVFESQLTVKALLLTRLREPGVDCKQLLSKHRKMKPGSLHDKLVIPASHTYALTLTLSRSLARSLAHRYNSGKEPNQ